MTENKTKFITIVLILSILFGVSGLICNGIYQSQKWSVVEKEVTETKQSSFKFKIGNFEYDKKGDPKQVTRMERQDGIGNIYLRYAGAILGGISLMFAIIMALFSKRYKIPSILASFGLICLAWEYALIAVGAAVFMIIISMISF